MVQNYVPQNVTPGSNLQILGCVIASDGSSERMNHIELHISQNEIQVWATDAGSAILREIAVLQNISLPFTRGYISLSDFHDNAAESANPSTVNHTFAWDNVTFDGPLLANDLSLDVLDSLTKNVGGELNLGWQAWPTTPASVTTAPLSSSTLAAEAASGQTALLTFNFNPTRNPITAFSYIINGTTMTGTVPFSAGAVEYGIVFPVPLSALVVGPQKITIWGNDGIIISNVDVVIPGAGE